jgi:hypothetical protein
MLFAGYAILKKGISFKQILLLMLIGFIALSFIVVARSGGAFVFSFNILDMAMDLIINNYTLYVGYEYVQENGSVIFTLIGSLLSAIPLLQGIVVNTFNIPIWERKFTRSEIEAGYTMLSENRVTYLVIEVDDALRIVSTIQYIVGPSLCTIMNEDMTPTNEDYAEILEVKDREGKVVYSKKQ